MHIPSHWYNTFWTILVTDQEDGLLQLSTSSHTSCSFSNILCSSQKIYPSVMKICLSTTSKATRSYQRPHLAQTIMLLSETYFPVFPSRCVAMLYTGILVVMTVASDKCFGHLGAGKMGRDKIKTTDGTEQARVLLFRQPWVFLWPQFILASHRVILMFKGLEILTPITTIL